jgi:hypothetical protein
LEPSPLPAAVVGRGKVGVFPPAGFILEIDIGELLAAAIAHDAIGGQTAHARRGAADREKVDFRTRSKWARLLRYAKVFKDPDEPLIDFVRRRGGINKCVRRYSRQLGRTWSTGRQ